MRWSAAAVLLVSIVVFARPVPVDSSAEGRRAFDDLTAAYRDERNGPNIGHELDRLESSDPDARASAGRYFHALFAQLLADEADHRDALDARRPYESSSGHRIYRYQLATEFASRVHTDEGIDAAVCLVEQDRVEETRRAGIDALRHINGPRMTGAFRHLLQPPSHYTPAVVAAIEESGKRHLSDLRDAVAPLTTDHRAAVRAAAFHEAASLGFTPGVYVPATAFTPFLETELHTIVGMVITPIPPSAIWARFQSTEQPVNGGVPYKQMFDGWLIDRTPESLHAVDWFGGNRILPSIEWVVTPRTFMQDAEEFASLRKKTGHSAIRPFLSNAPAHHWINDSVLSVPEALLAAWALDHGDRSAAATVLFPRLDAIPDECDLDRYVLNDIAWDYRDTMLRAFTYDRDYPAAIRIAAHLRRPCFDGFFDQQRAKELADQLTARQGVDFKTLTLPTPEAWKTMAASIDRAAQVAYLAERLRLMNCFQNNQPGGVTLTSRQIAERRFQRRPDGKLTTVINPFVELHGLRLTVRESAVLLPYLSDENFIPTFGFNRDFMADRRMYRVNELAAALVNDVAGHRLFDAARYDSADGPERVKLLTATNDWITKHAGLTPTQLQDELVSTGADYADFTTAIHRLKKLDAEAAFRQLNTAMRRFPQDRGPITGYLVRWYPDRTLDSCRVWIKDDDTEVRFHAATALVHLPGPDRAAAVAEFDRRFQHDADNRYYVGAMTDLLAVKDDPDVLKLLLSPIARFTPRQPAFGDHRSIILKRLLLAGRRESLEFITRTLADPNDVRVADETAKFVAEWKEDFYPPGQTDEKRRSRCDELNRWIVGQFDLIKAGKKSEIEANDESYPSRAFDVNDP